MGRTYVSSIQLRNQQTRTSDIRFLQMFQRFVEVGEHEK